MFFVLLCVFVCQDESQDENTCCLKDLQEGLVGKMLVRKSGKIQLILGNITLDVALGTSCAFLQVSYAHQCCVSPSGHPRCRWDWLFMGTDLEKFTIRSLLQSLCNEWVPSEWADKNIPIIHSYLYQLFGLPFWRHPFTCTVIAQVIWW